MNSTNVAKVISITSGTQLKSGTTLIAAAKLGVSFLGYEQDPEMHAKADRRLRRELGLFYCA